MSAIRACLGLWAVVLAATALAQDGQPRLGRLFLAPEQRAQLERQRQRDIPETRALEGGTLRLDGVVLRSSGKATVWVNGQARTEDATDSGLAVAASRRRPDRATLRPGGEPAAELRVGQTLDRASREIADGLAVDAIRVQRR